MHAPPLHCLAVTADTPAMPGHVQSQSMPFKGRSKGREGRPRLRNGSVALLQLPGAHLARDLGCVLAVLAAGKAPPKVVRRRALEVLRAPGRDHKTPISPMLGNPVTACPLLHSRSENHVTVAHVLLPAHVHACSHKHSTYGSSQRAAAPALQAYQRVTQDVARDRAARTSSMWWKACCATYAMRRLGCFHTVPSCAHLEGPPSAPSCAVHN